MLRTLTIDLEYQPLIHNPPNGGANELYKQAASGDAQTVSFWREKWLKNYEAAKDNFGSFSEKSVGRLFGLNRHKAAVVLGSGPSLKDAIEALKDNAAGDYPVLTISCLHNFGYFEDSGVHADYYVSLDSGEVVMDDFSESHKEKPDYYWEKSKGKKLIAYVGSDPKLWSKWQGEVYLFNALLPDPDLRAAKDKIERFAHYVSSGGNALGACMYIAKAIMGSSTIIYVGADFCFDYDMKFHSYKTKYDSPGNTLTWPDIYGIPRRTWPSYLNFKYWFDWAAMTLPGTWISASGGLLGAYHGGNLVHFKYGHLFQALSSYKHADMMILEERESATNAIKQRAELKLKDLYSNSQYEHDLVLF